MLNRPNGRRRLGWPFKRLLDETETGLSRHDDDDDDDDADDDYQNTNKLK